MLIFFPTHAKRSTHLSQSKPLGLCPSFEMWFFVLLFSHLHILQACRVLACWDQMSVVSLKKKKKVLYVQKSTRKHDFQERQDCHTDILICHHYLAAGMHSQTITTKRKLLLKWVAAVVASEQQMHPFPLGDLSSGGFTVNPAPCVQLTSSSALIKTIVQELCKKTPRHTREKSLKIDL